MGGSVVAASGAMRLHTRPHANPPSGVRGWPANEGAGVTARSSGASIPWSSNRCLPPAGESVGMYVAVGSLPCHSTDARPCPPRPLPATPTRYDYENAYDGGYDNYGDGVDGYGGKGA